MQKILPADLEAYIFSAVVSRLKGYDEDTFRTFNPLQHYGIYLGVGLSQMTGDYRHNYQRNLARRDRTRYICLRTEAGSKVYIIGEYVDKKRGVKLYPDEASKVFKWGMPIIGKIQQLLSESNSFKWVEFVRGNHDIRRVETEWYGNSSVS